MQTLDLVNQVQNKLQANKPISTTSTSQFTERVYSSDETKAVNYFFAKLKTVFGAKFDHFMPTPEDITAQKQFYAPLVANLDRQSIDDGFSKIALLRTQNKHVWLDIAELLPHFIHSLKSESDLLDAYNEYAHNGKDIRVQRFVNGKVLKVPVGKQWTSGALFEVAKRLGPCKFLTGSEQSKIDRFTKAYQKVLQEEQSGAVFEAPAVGIERQDTKEDKQRRLEQSRKSQAYEDFKRNLKGE